MSRLYSSPEVSSLGCLLWVFALGCLPWNVPSLGLRLSWSLGGSSRLGIKSFGYKVARVRSWVRSGTRLTRTESLCSPIPHRFRRTSRSTRTRSPTVQRRSQAASNHSACQNEHRFFARSFKRNIRLSFALRSDAAQHFKAIALKQTCVQEPFTRGGLSL